MAESTSRPVRIIAHFLEEVGLVTMWHSSLDVKLLCAQRFVRIADDHIGLFMTLTLIGDVVISFFLTLFADKIGRKAVLSLGSVLMAGSGVVFALTGNYWVLLAAAVFGVISPSGNEIGPFRAVEESTLAHLTVHEKLPDVFAWYSLVGAAGTALGQLVCGWMLTSLQSLHGWEFIPSCRIMFVVYAAVGVIKLIFTLALSRKVEYVEEEPVPQNDETRPLLGDSATVEEFPKKKGLFASIEKGLWSLVIRLFILFGLDAFASGLASMAWMTYFFHRKFSLPEGELGTIFFVTSSISAASMLVASSIAKRFDHGLYPSAISYLSGDDLRAKQPAIRAHIPRSARLYPEHGCGPPAIMGAVNVVKTTTQSMGPLLTGILARNNMFGVSFIIAGVLKVVYDLGMLTSFAGKEAAKRKQTKQSDDEAQ
ncbi:uncharacterized protein N7477_006467 [Penicillium maclennaniae]|uniref:uncharacterized protein n=1 Tax=Penicillium maclennaniae TaxID=1343394 RepID=UPI00253F80D1|nr:uncharacterized protein N7477_006467 [Penicillium maclennaniae]KAJ5667897.1 hypothetical protein N7477_006467 [Penicillium maclennaniae]